MRYINRLFTYLLSYLLTYIGREEGRRISQRLADPPPFSTSESATVHSKMPHRRGLLTAYSIAVSCTGPDTLS